MVLNSLQLATKFGGVGAGAQGFLGVRRIARVTVNLRKEIRNKKRAPDAGATATIAFYVVLLFRTRSEKW